MPGSLLLTNDVRSDLSDVSTRSLDSKISGKRVSFNKAVRVKQYPWKPDTDLNNAEHLTLPSSRFWFKVYKRKNESPPSNNIVSKPNDTGIWSEENTGSIHLAPIAEVEDQDIEVEKFHSDTVNGAWDKKYTQEYDNKGRNNYISFSQYYDDNHPIEPPVDYFEDTHSERCDVFRGAKPAWVNNDSENDQHDNYSDNSNLWDRNAAWKRDGPEMSKQFGNANSYPQITKNVFTESLRLPRMMIRNAPGRRSDRKWDASDNTTSRERRSRSHDDHTDNENKLKEHKKADKSVSTEDLNLNGDKTSPSKRLFKVSRDIATQCYGTLSRERNIEKSPTNRGTLMFRRSAFNSSLSNGDHGNINTLRSSQLRTRASTNEVKSNPSLTRSVNKDANLNEKVSNHSLAYSDTNCQTALQTNGKHSDFKRYHSQITTTKMNAGNNALSRNENMLPTQSSRSSRTETKGNYQKRDLNSHMVNGESTKCKEPNRGSSTIGYVRGRQIPLSAVNTNTNRKFLGRNEIRNNRGPISSSRNGSNGNTSKFLGYTSNSDSGAINDSWNRKYFISNTENMTERNRKGLSSSKNFTVDYNEDNHSMIDWSLSGFQLAPKPDNGPTSVSDSECTIHRRPPLLMYIPGVSYHDRPAVEDDRLSALSDMSRSEMADGISPLANISNSPRNEIRRRHSMPRDSKLKWIKWKSSGQK